LNLVIGKLCFGNDIKSNWKCNELLIKCQDFFKKC
jgi:hypothetical protein